jgi:hypothetical protein
MRLCLVFVACRLLKWISFRSQLRKYVYDDLHELRASTTSILAHSQANSVDFLMAKRYGVKDRFFDHCMMNKVTKHSTIYNLQTCQTRK